MATASDSIPASGIKGDVVAGAGAAGIEAQLLAALAIRDVASSLAMRLEHALKPGQRPRIGVITASDAFALEQSNTIEITRALMEAARQEAASKAHPVSPVGKKLLLTPTTSVAAAIPAATAATGIAAPAVGALIGAISAAASYLKTDYTYSGVEIAVDDSLFVITILEALRERFHGSECVCPGLRPISPASIGVAMLNALGDLSSMRGAAAAEVEAATKNNDAAAANAWQVVVTLYDSFVAWMMASDSRGNVPLSKWSLELELRSLLDSGGVVVVVKPHRAGGSSVIRKTVFSSFGVCDPFTVAGGALMSYAIFDKTGLIQSSVLGAMSRRFELRDVPAAISAETSEATRRLVRQGT